MDNGVQKGKMILFTYFTNLGFFHPTNEVCIGIYNNIQEKLKGKDDYIEYLPLKTTSFASKLNHCSSKKLKQELSKPNYKYIISIGKNYSESPIFERRKDIDDCYVFDINSITKNKFICNKKFKGEGMGACHRLRDILVDFANNPNTNCKVEFIHIPSIDSSIIDFIANKIIDILEWEKGCKLANNTCGTYDKMLCEKNYNVLFQFSNKWVLHNFDLQQNQ